MSKTQTETKEWVNIDYTNTSAYRTVKQWGKIAGIVVKGGPTGEKGGVPRDEYRQLQKLKQLDLAVKPEKGPILKVISSMARMIIKEPDSKGLQVPRECLTIIGEFRGTDFGDMEVRCTFFEGWNWKPVMGKVYRTGKRFDSETGDDLGVIEVRGQVIEYNLEVPKDAAKRKQFIDKIIQNSPGTFAENINYYWKEGNIGNFPLGGTRDFSYTYEDFVNYSIEELKDMHNRGGGAKGPGYYRDKDNKLRDREGKLVS